VNKPRIAGTRWESAVVAYLRSRGLTHAERRALRGRFDGGDVVGIPGWVCEAKATRALALSEAMNEAKAAAGNTGARHYAVIQKRRNHATQEGYVVMPLWAFVDLLEGS
jgi:hypothetical protein